MTICGYLGMPLLSGRLVLTTTSASSASTKAVAVSSTKWGVAYKISKKEDQEVAITYLGVREEQYDKKAHLDFFTEPMATTQAVSGVLV